MPQFDVSWDGSQIEILKALTVISSILSLFGTLFIAYSYIFVQNDTPFAKRRRTKKKRKLHQKQQELERSRKLNQRGINESLQLQIESLENELRKETPQETESFLRFNKFVFYLSLAHMANAVVWILLIALHESEDALYCEVLAPLNVYLFGVSFCWTVMIATEICYRFTHTSVSLFGETVIPESIAGVSEFWYHLFAWALPSLVVAVPAIRGDFGRGVWSCWIKETEEGWVYIFGVIVALVMFYCTAAYIYVALIFRQRLEISGMLGEAERRKVVFLQTRISTYLLVFILCWSPAFLRHVMALFNPPANTALFILTAVGAFFLPLNGFLDSLVYGTNAPLWEKVCNRLKNWLYCFCCSTCCRKPGYEEIMDEGTELAIQERDD